MVKVYELNLRLAKAAHNQAIILNSMLQTLPPSGISENLSSILEVMSMSSKIVKLFNSRLLWQNKLNVSANFKEILSRMEPYYARFCKFIKEHTVAYYAICATVVVVNVVLSILFLPWIAFAGLVGVGAILLKKFVFNKENTDVVWNANLAKEITKVTSQLSSSNISYETILLSLKKLYKECKNTVKVVDTDECPICFREFAPLLGSTDITVSCIPGRFDNQGCGHLVCVGCASQMLERGNGSTRCPLCRQCVTHIRMVCSKCKNFMIGSYREWKCTNNHVICLQCAKDNSNKCIYCFNAASPIDDALAKLKLH